ncbi:uncharacterized protein JCM6883_002217 [Sporobolomyces salmoneus]|uniref:uncharacterized protein n=1 Tax=Sporobolomyces salmoneus TaxID=183962 RepID=UPI0031827ADF
MSDSTVPDTNSTVSTPREDDKWTILSPDARSSASATSSSSSLEDQQDEESRTITPSSPVQSLVDSDEGDPKLVPSTLDPVSPIMTPLPASPIDEEDDLVTSNKTEESRIMQPAVAEAKGENGKEPAGEAKETGSATDQVGLVPSSLAGEGVVDIVLLQVEQNVPSLVFTRPTMSPSRSDSSRSPPPAEDSNVDVVIEEEKKKTDVPPLDTNLVPTFLTDREQLFASPSSTNNAAPNSAISPKTTSFFFSIGSRSPPRVGGAIITEIPSDAEGHPVFARGQVDRQEQTETETETETEREKDAPAGEVEKPSPNSTNGNTLPLISPNHSSDIPVERPAITSSRYYVSTFSRDPSPAPRSRNRVEHRPRRNEQKSSGDYFRSRTYVSSSRPERKPRKEVKEAKTGRVERPMSMTHLVDELKKSLSQDSTAYYTLKGVLAEYEDAKRRSPPSNSETVAAKIEVSEHIVREEAKEEKLTPRRYRSSFKPRAPPVKSFSLTQTDSESEADTYTLPRRSGERLASIKQAHQGFRGTQPLPIRTAVPVYPAHLSPRSQPADLPSFAPVPATGAKPPLYKSLKLVKPESGAPISKLKLKDQASSAQTDGRPNPSSSTSALRYRPDLLPSSSPHRREVSSSSSRPPVPSHLEAAEKPAILVNYLRPAESIELVPSSSSSSKRKVESGSKRRLERGEGKVDGAKEREGAKAARASEKGARSNAKGEGKNRDGGKREIIRGEGSGKGKGKERENSISFDFDDFF